MPTWRLFCMECYYQQQRSFRILHMYITVYIYFTNSIVNKIYRVLSQHLKHNIFSALHDGGGLIELWSSLRLIIVRNREGTDRKEGRNGLWWIYWREDTNEGMRGYVWKQTGFPVPLMNGLWKLNEVDKFVNWVTIYAAIQHYSYLLLLRMLVFEIVIV